MVSILTFRHCYYVWKDLDQKVEQKSKSFKLISAMYIIYLFCQSLGGSIAYSTYFFTSTCIWRTIIMMLFAAPMGAISRYWIYMFRLKVLTEEEMYGYSHCFKRFVSVSPYLIAVISITFTIMTGYFYHNASALGYPFEGGEGYKFMKFCILPPIPEIMAILWLFNRYFWTFVAAFGFVAPLNRLIKDMLKEESNPRILKEIQCLIDVTTKFTVLTWIPAIFDVVTFTLLIIFQASDAMEEWGFLWRLNGAIRAFTELVCILFMTPYYNGTGLFWCKSCRFLRYERLCYGPMVLVNRCSGYSKYEQSGKLVESQNTDASAIQTNHSEIEV